MHFKRLKQSASSASSPSRALVFIPGWAFGGDILSLAHGLDGTIEILYPTAPPWRCKVDGFLPLFKQLRERFGNVILAGWSLGAVIVHRLMHEIGHLVDQFVLISPKAYYSHDEIGFIKGYLAKDKVACLKYFYRQCFKGQDHGYGLFKKQLECGLIRSFSQDELYEGLDFLYANPIPEIVLPPKARCLLVQGTEDRIVPLLASPAVIAGTGEYRRILIEDAGHLPFLKWEDLVGYLDG